MSYDEDGQLNGDQEYHYDSQRRLTHITAWGAILYQYSYVDDSVFVHKDNILSNKYIVHNGLADSTVEFSSGNVIEAESFKYNANGYLEESVYYQPIQTPVKISTQVYFYDDDNRIRQESYNDFMQFSPVTYHHYNTTNTIGNENIGLSFLGKQDKNAVKAIYRLSHNTHYSYHYNSKGQIDTAFWYHEQSGDTISTQKVVYLYY